MQNPNAIILCIQGEKQLTFGKRQLIFRKQNFDLSCLLSYSKFCKLMTVLLEYCEMYCLCVKQMALLMLKGAMLLI